MGTYQITVHYTDEPKITEKPDSPPKRSLTTAWTRCNLGLFRINFTVIGPERQESQRYLAPGGRQADRIGKAVSHLVKTLQEELR